VNVFAGLIDQAKSAASNLVLKYLARASVAVPFVIAAAGALNAVRLLARILPLVVLLVLIGALFWPTKEGEPPLEDELDAVRKPNGSDDHMPSSLRH
jgi:hypothetical protein